MVYWLKYIYFLVMSQHAIHHYMNIYELWQYAVLIVGIVLQDLYCYRFFDLYGFWSTIPYTVRTAHALCYVFRKLLRVHICLSICKECNYRSYAPPPITSKDSLLAFPSKLKALVAFHTVKVVPDKGFYCSVERSMSKFLVYRFWRVHRCGLNVNAFFLLF